MTKISMINLGCAKNQVDAEEMLGKLEADGHEVGFRDAPADVRNGTDVVVVNTCGFIDAAREESINTILEAVERKKRGEVARVIVTGCLSQRYGRELAEAIPEVDAFLGAGQMGEMSGLIAPALIRTEQLFRVGQTPHHRFLKAPTRVRNGAAWSAYLKISEGCDHACTFCAIPGIRGKHVSKPMEDILAEAAGLAAAGAREINLIAQDSTQYGHDIYGELRLPALLRELSQIDGIHWLRLFYCYPSRVNRALIEAIAQTPKVCHYIDMPLQHADDEILRAMRRPLTARHYLDILRDFRAAAPDVCIRTTFIVGFPGETRAHFAALERFVEEARFDRVGVFQYSPEEGTPAHDMANPVSARTRHARMDRLMQRQQAISLERNREWIGRDLEVLVEGRSATDPTSVTGRSFRDAPEIDGQVTVRRCTALPGSFIRARVVEAQPYDLIAE